MGHVVLGGANAAGPGPEPRQALGQIRPRGKDLRKVSHFDASCVTVPDTGTTEGAGGGSFALVDEIVKRLGGGPQDGAAERTRAVAWKRVDATGLERFELRPESWGWTLRGTILLLHQGAPFEARYLVKCNRAWATLAVAVDVSGPDGHRSLGLAVEGGRWTEGDGEREEIRGCVDVDLSWTPSTNALPIRRLDLAVGETRAVTAAWVRFPELTVERLPQE